MSAVADGLLLVFLPTNLLALVTIGLLAGQAATRFPIATAAAFAFGMTVASVGIAAALRAQDTLPIWLLTVAALAGITVAIARPIPQVARMITASLVGGLIALNAPPQAITIPLAIASQIGTAIAAFAILAVVTAIAMKAEQGWQRIGVRIVASWIAASAILVLALRLAR
jgi:hypothetical protein